MNQQRLADRLLEKPVPQSEEVFPVQQGPMNLKKKMQPSDFGSQNKEENMNIYKI